MEALIDQLRALNTAAILLKGGHLESDSSSNDLLITQDDVSIFETTRINTKNTHGTGCTLSSAIASYLAQNNTLHQAVSNGKSYITQAIAHADELDIGKGHGPVHHFYALNR
jgi:hydroxymethylpyrimidine/phosphomethylpyrimidine kinase